MIRSRTAVAIMAAVVLLAGCESKETRLQSFLLKGNTSLKESDPEKALYYYREALKLDPCYADALNNAGTIHHQQGHYPEAIEQYSKAIECDASYVDARFNRANSYYAFGESFSALADIEAIIKARPDTAAVYFLKGLVHMKQRDYDQASAAFSKAIELNIPNALESRVNLASARIFLKRFDEARAELEECLKINDKEPVIYNSLALIEIENKNYEQALVQVNKGLALKPDEPYFLNNRGFIHIQLNKLDEAAADIDQSITLDPYNAWAYRNKGILSIARKDYTTAERLLKKAVEIDKNVERAQYYLGIVYRNTGRAAEACAAFRLSNDAGDGLVSAEE